MAAPMCSTPASAVACRCSGSRRKRRFWTKTAPSQFDSVWEEHIEGRRNGRYHLTTQGARVYGFSYEHARDGRRTEFNEDVEAWQEDGCQWPGVEPLTVASSLLD